MSPAKNRGLSNQERAGKLKEEGNNLFVKKRYDAAAQKFTEAIDLDDKNAILYANRAACMINLERYQEAYDDATLATQLKPDYAKAWGRLATAQDGLQLYQESQVSWRKALDTLPSNNLTDVEKAMKRQLEEGLVNALMAGDALKDPGKGKTGPLIEGEEDEVFPWVCAINMIEGLMVRGDYTSSAWPLYTAYVEFAEGTMAIDEYERGSRKKRKKQAIGQIAEALVTEQRVFYLPSFDWVDKIQRQVQRESDLVGAWTYKGLDEIYNEAKGRLKQKGWKDLRLALDTTINSWIVLGHLEGTAMFRASAQLEYLTRAITLIDWVRETWPKARSEVHGGVFDDKFLRGLQNLRLIAQLKAAPRRDNDPRHDEFLEQVLQAADALLELIRTDPKPSRELDPTSAIAFYDYPRGEAHVAKALYYSERAQKAEDKVEKENLHARASEHYINGAECFPKDDEKRCWFYYIGIQRMMMCQTPITMILNIMNRLESSLQRTRKIWGRVMERDGRDDSIKNLLSLRPRLERLDKQKSIDTPWKAAIYEPGDIPPEEIEGEPILPFGL